LDNSGKSGQILNSFDQTSSIAPCRAGLFEGGPIFLKSSPNIRYCAIKDVKKQYFKKNSAFLKNILNQEWHFTLQ